MMRRTERRTAALAVAGGTPLPSAPAEAKSIGLVGTVKDRDGADRPIADARVEVWRQKLDPFWPWETAWYLHESTTTDATGHFSAHTEFQGRYRARI